MRTPHYSVVTFWRSCFEYYMRHEILVCERFTILIVLSKSEILLMLYSILFRSRSLFRIFYNNHQWIANMVILTQKNLHFRMREYYESSKYNFIHCYLYCNHSGNSTRLFTFVLFALR